jgi:hypothetical protein
MYIHTYHLQRGLDKHLVQIYKVRDRMKPIITLDSIFLEADVSFSVANLNSFFFLQ